jgi:hypothetical protein
MSDYTRGDDPVYNGFREGWACPCDAKEEDIELYEIVEGIDLDRLREICKAEREGRCKILPCKDGAKVYRLVNDCHNCDFFLDYSRSNDGNSHCAHDAHRLEHHIYPQFINSKIKCRKTILEQVFLSDDCRYHMSDIGKTVFLTRPEAEAALQEGE